MAYETGDIRTYLNGAGRTAEFTLKFTYVSGPNGGISPTDSEMENLADQIKASDFIDRAFGSDLTGLNVTIATTVDRTVYQTP